MSIIILGAGKNNQTPELKQFLAEVRGITSHLCDMLLHWYLGRLHLGKNVTYSALSCKSYDHTSLLQDAMRFVLDSSVSVHRLPKEFGCCSTPSREMVGSRSCVCT